LCYEWDALPAGCRQRRERASVDNPTPLPRRASAEAFGEASRKSNQVTFGTQIFLAAYIELSTHWLGITGAIGLRIIIAQYQKTNSNERIFVTQTP
jgi:hypothetical protein